MELGDCWLSEGQGWLYPKKTVITHYDRVDRYFGSSQLCLGLLLAFSSGWMPEESDSVAVWGIHAVSSAVLIMVPATGAAAVDDY